MTTAVGSAAGSSTALAIGRTGYIVDWIQIRYPHEAGYQVCWIGITLPYIVTSITLIQGGGEGGRGARSKRPIVDDRNDLQDLCEIWELIMRKAA